MEKVKNEKITGVVSFIDILGWKGIWSNPTSPIDTLNEFMYKFQRYMAFLSAFSYSRKNYEAILFSDTIVIFTPEFNFEESIRFHSEACKWAIEHGLRNDLPLPLRGAIGYGEYSYSRSQYGVTMVGSVIDEVSVWGEKVDWIGVILAPSVIFKSRFDDCLGTIENLSYIRKYDSIPFKEKTVEVLDLCVKWGDSNGVKLLENLVENQKYTSPEITLKYLNTLLFLESLDKATVKGINKEMVNSKENNVLRDTAAPYSPASSHLRAVETFTLRNGTSLEFGELDLLSVRILDISSDYVKVL